jgi:hypothetical protein
MTLSGPDSRDGKSSLCQLEPAETLDPWIPPKCSNRSSFSIGARRATPMFPPRQGGGEGLGGERQPWRRHFGLCFLSEVETPVPPDRSTAFDMSNMRHWEYVLPFVLGGSR